MGKRTAVLFVGPDLTSNGGGIASVAKTYYLAYQRGNYNFDYIFHRTIGHNSRKMLRNGLFFLISYIKLILILVNRKNIKIVHIHSSSHYSFFRKSIVALTAKAFRKKVIIHLHSSRFYEFFMSEKKLLSMWIYYVFKKVDLVITLCSKWEQVLRDKYPSVNIITVHNPINSYSSDKPIIRSREDGMFVVCFLAFLSQNKGLYDLLEVAKFFNSQKEKIKFVIAGKGEQENFLKEITKKKDYSNVEFAGWADDKQKEHLYKTSNIYFLPSYKEGMPISILEAMSYSLPIISTNISGIPDEVTNGVNGFTYNPGDIKGYIEGISTLYRDKKFYENASKASWYKVKSFSHEAIFDSIAKLYFKMEDIYKTVNYDKQDK